MPTVKWDLRVARLTEAITKEIRHVTTSRFLGAVITLAVTLVFFLLFWNRFAGIRSGLGGYGSALALLNGQLPYRDYFAASPPLFSFTSQTALLIFGNTITATRAFGVIERLVIAGVLFCWLRRIFSSKHAMVATTVTMIVSACDLSDPISSYNHESLMWAIGSGFAASFALDRGAGSRRMAIAALLSGLLAGLSFATKQTMGLGVILCVPLTVCLCLLRLAGLRKAVAFLAFFLIGVAAAGGALLLWLYRLGIVRIFLMDIFIKGPAAKAGSPLDFLKRDYWIASRVWPDVLFALACLLLLVSAIRRSAVLPVNDESPGDAERAPSLLLHGAFLMAAVLLGAALSYGGVPGLRPLTTPFIYLTLFVSFSLPICYLWPLIHGKLSVRQAQIGLLAAVSFAMAFMVSLSFPVFEAMLLPGAGLVVALALAGSTGLPRAAVYQVCFLIVCVQTALKLDVPFAFGGWGEPPVREAIERSTIPELRGLRLPRGIVDFLEGTAAIVAARTKPGDTIFTYPETGIIYSIAHRKAPTLSGSHNIDVVNDEFAREEARRLLEHRPAVLVYFRESESAMRFDEELWRMGKKSGQRDIVAAVEQLSAEYELVRVFKVPPGDRIVSVYARRPGDNP